MLDEYAIKARRKERILKTQKDLIKKQLEIRRVEHNIIPNNQFKVNTNLILDEDEYSNKEQELYVIDCEEEKDQEALKIFIKEHKRAFSYLYNKYANNGYSSKDKNDQLKAKLGTIGINELYRMMKDYNVSLTQSELARLIRLVNFHITRYNDPVTMTYKGFIELFIQIAVYIYSKINPTLPAAKYTQQLLEHFKRYSKMKEENKQLFDSSSMTILGDNNTFNTLNKEIKANRNYPLPREYEKVQCKSLVYSYNFPHNTPIPENKRIVIEILDAIVNECLGIHILEPIVEVKQEMYVVPRVDVFNSSKKHLTHKETNLERSAGIKQYK